MRSQNEPGLSIITLVFTDDTPVYFARQLVSERLDEVRTRLPEGVNPVLGPVSTALSEVYQYTLEKPGDGERPLTKEELMERRTIQDWVVRPLLRSVSGVAEINSTGGYVRQYQVLVDPVKMRYYGVTIGDVHRALSRNNENTSGGILPQGPEVFLVRGLGLLRNIEDIRSIVIKEFRNTPVYLKDLAEVRIGEAVRYGAMLRGGYTEAVGGIVSMIAGGNAKEIVSRIKERVEQINSNNMLPEGLQIVPYYDRSELVDAALDVGQELPLGGELLADGERHIGQRPQRGIRVRRLGADRLLEEIERAPRHPLAERGGLRHIQAMVIVNAQHGRRSQCLAQLDQRCGGHRDGFARLEQRRVIRLGVADAGADDVPAALQQQLRVLDQPRP